MAAVNEPGAMDLKCVASAMERLARAGHNAWREGLMAGFSGNLSMRLEPGRILITTSGIGKGQLGPEDFVVVDDSGRPLGSGVPSSETGLHVALYAVMPDCQSITHIHPPRMQALELLLARQGNEEKDFINLDLFEARIWRKKLAIAGAGAPGSEETAQAAASALAGLLPAQPPLAVWLPRHGLCGMGLTPEQALGIGEELEHLAGIQLISGQNL